MYNYIRENKLKFTAIVVAIVLLLSTFIGTAVYSKGFTQWGDGTGSGIINGDNKEELDSDKVQDLPNSIIVTSDSSGSVTFKAIVKPADADVKELTWAIVWEDPTDFWANGKAPIDYVNIVVNPADSTQITLSSVGIFQEAITLTATSVSNPKVSASAKIDYLAESTLSAFNFTYNNTSIDILKDNNGITPVVSVASGDTEPSINEELSSIIINPVFEYGPGTMHLPKHGSAEFSYTPEYMALLTGSSTPIYTKPINIQTYNPLVFNEDLLCEMAGTTFIETGYTTEQLIAEYFYNSLNEPLANKNHFQMKYTYCEWLQIGFIPYGPEITEIFSFSFNVDHFAYVAVTEVASIEMGPDVIL